MKPFVRLVLETLSYFITYSYCCDGTVGTVQYFDRKLDNCSDLLPSQYPRDTSSCMQAEFDLIEYRNEIWINNQCLELHSMAEMKTIYM